MITYDKGFLIVESHGGIVIADGQTEISGHVGDPEIPAFARKAVGLGAPTVSEFMEKHREG